MNRIYLSRLHCLSVKKEGVSGDFLHAYGASEGAIETVLKHIYVGNMSGGARGKYIVSSM